MIKSNALYTVIILLMSTYCCCQDANFNFSKIKLYQKNILCYANVGGHIVLHKKDTVEKIIYKINSAQYDFFDISPNSNFIVKDSFLLSLRVEKNGLLCTNQDEFQLVPWKIFSECRSTNTRVELPKGFVFSPSSTILNIENKASMFWSKNHIHFDFIHFKKNVLMLILVDNVLHVYENLGPINNNEWKLIKSFSSNMQVPFQTYVNDSEQIIVQFNPDNVFQLNLQEKFLKRVRQKPKANQCLIYDHQSEKYFWITQEQVKKLITSKKPNEFIQSILDRN